LPFRRSGPKAAGVLQKLTKTDLASIKYYHFAIGEFAGVQNVNMSCTGYTGAGGFEIYVQKASAEKVWNAIFEAGKDVNIKPIALAPATPCALRWDLPLWQRYRRCNVAARGRAWMDHQIHQRLYPFGRAEEAEGNRSEAQVGWFQNDRERNPASRL